MKYIEKEDELVHGEIYVGTNGTIDRIYKYDDDHRIYINVTENKIFRSSMCEGTLKRFIKEERKSVRKATSHEVKWLKSCIAANKFVPQPKIINDLYEI